MSDDEETETVQDVKVVLLGESGVGKSSIIKRFVTQIFDPDIDPSISSKVSPKEIKIIDIKKKIKFNIWDTAGQEKYRSLAKIFYKDAPIIIFVYNITSKESFDYLKNYWYNQVKESSIKNVIFGVVGNKSDLYQNSDVDEKEARDWADSINAIFQLTSAKSNSGIDVLFQNLAKKYFDPKYDYKKEDNEAKEDYVKRKKEQEENKKKEKQKDDDEDDNVKIPEIRNISLDKRDIIRDDKKKKGKCC